MTEVTFSGDGLNALADIACDGALTEQEFVQLEQLLHGNVEAQQYYLTHVCLDRWLRWEFEHQSHEPAMPQSAPTIGFLSTTFPATLGYSSGWPVAYLTATVITGLLILGFWLMPVSRQVATHSLPPAAERQIAPEPQQRLVGRITGMVDCKIGDSRVSLGQKCQLASGLMEITYDTGARVILQGPVTYSVEANGGYLAVGKLTGKMEKKTSNPQSLISNPFSIRTPTATVTDLGTEFGVEVSKEGGTTSHVFQGKIVVLHRCVHNLRHFGT